MFKTKSLLVLGAGASAEIGLPTGYNLTQQISCLLSSMAAHDTLTSGDQAFFEALKRKGGDAFDQYRSAAGRIARGVSLVKSIDNFIDINRNDEFVATCGKAAIIYSILHAERLSRLFVDSSARKQLDFHGLENTWFSEFGSMLVQGMTFPNIDSIFSNITILCFNYDRCVEEFLAQYLSSVWPMELSDARELIDDKLRILRPYGMIAPLPTKTNSDGVAFGGELAGKDIFELSAYIKTYSEQANLLDQIREAVTQAETVAFLGFGFHPQNMELIAPTAANSGVRRVYASALRKSIAQRDSIKSELWRRLQPADNDTEIIVQDCQCHGLLTEFHRSLIFGERYDNSLRIVNWPGSTRGV